MKKIVWKDIEDFEGKYMVSNTGLVKSLPRKNVLRERILKQSNDKDCYLVVNFGLGKKGEVKQMKVHRLVASSFHENKKGLPEVNHKDGDRKNNNDWNLEWSTTIDNIKHSRRTVQNKKRGVHFCNTKNRYVAKLQYEGTTKNLGLFSDKNKAYTAFYNAYVEIHGVVPWVL